MKAMFNHPILLVSIVGLSMMAPLAPALADDASSPCDAAVAALASKVAELPPTSSDVEKWNLLATTLAGPCKVDLPEAQPAASEDVLGGEPGDVLPPGEADEVVGFFESLSPLQEDVAVPIECPGGGGAGRIEITIDSAVQRTVIPFGAGGSMGSSAEPSVESASTGVAYAGSEAGSVLFVAGVPLPLSDDSVGVECGVLRSKVWGLTIETPVACRAYGDGVVSAVRDYVLIKASTELKGAGCNA